MSENPEQCVHDSSGVVLTYFFVPITSQVPFFCLPFLILVIYMAITPNVWEERGFLDLKTPNERILFGVSDTHYNCYV